MSDVVREGYKQTEVGVIPDEWKVLLLQECTERVVVGIASAASHAYRESGIPMLRNQNIKYGYLDDAEIIYLDPNYENKFKNKRLKLGDLITARTGYPGATCVIKKEYVNSQCFTSLICTPINKTVNSDYLSVYINSQIGKNYIAVAQIGGAQQNVNSGALKKMPIIVPPLPEQQAIASTLADVDTLLDSLEELLTKKRQLKQAAMQELLTGKTRLEGFEGEWEEKRLGDVITTILGGGTPSRDRADYWHGSIPWATIKDISSFDPLRTQEYISDLGLKTSASRLVRARTLILSTRMNVGKAVMFDIDVSINQDLKAIIFDSFIWKGFIRYWFDSQKSYLDSVGGGSTVKGISISDIKNLSLRLPTLPEQKAIAAILSEMDAELETLEERVTKTRDLKQGMMQELLTGRTRLV